MESRRIINLTSDFLVNACQLAYVEEAYGTLSILENLNDLLRYITRPIETITLFEEITILEKYITLYRTRFGERLSIIINNSGENKAIYIERMKIINEIDRYLMNIIDNSQESIVATFDCYLNSESKLIIKIMDDKGTTLFEKEI